MNEAVARVLPASVQLELDNLRDQRDLYRSLLLSEPAKLAVFMTHALEHVENIRVTLRTPTRDPVAFRGKIEHLVDELTALGEALIGLHLPTVGARQMQALTALREVESRQAATGNDLLPAMVVLEELCSHLTVAADCVAVHVPLETHEPAALELESSQRRSQLRLAAALEQMAEKLAADHGKRVGLVTMGLEDIPAEWTGPLFDLLGQLVRNAIEHGIEETGVRAGRTKPPIGTLVIEFIDCGAHGYELNVQDDGGGLDAEGIAAAAIKHGLVPAGGAQGLGPTRLVSLIFQPGLSTAPATLDGKARRGQGMCIVRDHVQRLGGRLQFSTKRGHFTRYCITLPPLATGESSG
ncbi:MAG TPA: ATP-binding protein [Steroidobacteraceae bacterium]|jgi:two-component system chemotaxis sensor kinase CheA|nr:ATP-binding protein [Steroidobacteraceae bacterium]